MHLIKVLRRLGRALPSLGQKEVLLESDQLANKLFVSCHVTQEYVSFTVRDGDAKSSHVIYVVYTEDPTKSQVAYFQTAASCVQAVHIINGAMVSPESDFHISCISEFAEAVTSAAITQMDAMYPLKQD